MPERVVLVSITRNPTVIVDSVGPETLSVSVVNANGESPAVSEARLS